MQTEGRCYDNQLIAGFLQTSKLTAFTLCSGILKGNEISPRIHARIDNGNNTSTLCKNLVNVGLVNLKFERAKVENCAATWPQFDDRPFWQSTGVQNQLEYCNFDSRRLISNHFTVSCKNG